MNAYMVGSFFINKKMKGFFSAPIDIYSIVCYYKNPKKQIKTHNNNLFKK